MQTITYKGKEYQVSFSNLRACHAEGFYKLPGCHGLTQAECKACVVYTLAAVTDTDGCVYTGIAARSWQDQFSNKIGKAIASGRALKAMVEGNTKHTYVFRNAEDFVAYVKKLRSMEKLEQEPAGFPFDTATSFYEIIGRDYGFFGERYI